MGASYRKLLIYLTLIYKNTENFLYNAMKKRYNKKKHLSGSARACIKKNKAPTGTTRKTRDNKKCQIYFVL